MFLWRTGENYPELSLNTPPVLWLWPLSSLAFFGNKHVVGGKVFLHRSLVCNFLPDRYVCLDGSSTPNPTDNIVGYICPAGFYCTAGTTIEEPCPLGTFQASQGQDNCTTCPAGYMCDQVNMTVPNVCITGNYYQSFRDGKYITKTSLFKYIENFISKN